jgi:hypothetical protein
VEREALFLKPVEVAAHGQIEVRRTRAIAFPSVFTAPVVDAQHRHPVITATSVVYDLEREVIVFEVRPV